MPCPRCGKNPKFIIHLCQPTMEWIDKQLESEVQMEIEKMETNFKDHGNIYNKN